MRVADSGQLCSHASVHVVTGILEQYTHVTYVPKSRTKKKLKHPIIESLSYIV